MNNIVNIQLQNFRFDLCLHEDETLSNRLKEFGYHNYNNIDLLQKFLKPGQHFLDLGANIGWYTVLGSFITGDRGRVYAFEPDKNNFALLEQNCQINNCNNTVLENYIVSDITGTERLYRNPENFGDHSLGKNTHLRCFNYHTESHCDIKSLRLDQYFDYENFSAIALIKMDTQGSEPKIVRGLEKLLTKHRPTIIMEYSPGHIYDVGNSPFEIFAFIENFRYQPYHIIEHGIEPCEIKPLDAIELFEKTFELKNTYGCIDLLLIPQ